MCLRSDQTWTQKDAVIDLEIRIEGICLLGFKLADGRPTRHGLVGGSGRGKVFRIKAVSPTEPTRFVRRPEM